MLKATIEPQKCKQKSGSPIAIPKIGYEFIQRSRQTAVLNRRTNAALGSNIKPLRPQSTVANASELFVRLPN
jgi:hypothetical protein